MRKVDLIFLWILGLMLISQWGCATSKLSETYKVTSISHPIETIALAPSGGLMADAIGVELFNRGYKVFDTNTMSNLLVRDGISELEVLKPQNLLKLQDAGIDAFLTARSAGAVRGTPESVSVRIGSVKNLSHF